MLKIFTEKIDEIIRLIKTSEGGIDVDCRTDFCKEYRLKETHC